MLADAIGTNGVLLMRNHGGYHRCTQPTPWSLLVANLVNLATDADAAATVASSAAHFNGWWSSVSYSVSFLVLGQECAPPAGVLARRGCGLGTSKNAAGASSFIWRASVMTQCYSMLTPTGCCRVQLSVLQTQR